MFGPILTTPQVLREVEVGLAQGYREALAVRRAIAERSIHVRRAPLLTLPPPRLDAGELSVLALALRIPEATAVLDDLAAIRAAKHLGLRVRSTPFVLLENVQRGRLGHEDFRRILDALLALEYHISPSLFLFLVEAADKVARR